MSSLVVNYPLRRRHVNGFGHYKLFQAIRLHFHPAVSFSLIKYSGRTSIKRETYDEKKGHRLIYERLAVNYDTHQLFRMYVMAAANNMLGSYPGHVLDNGGEQFLNDFEAVISNPDYYFEISAEEAARFCIEHDCGIRTYLNMQPYSPLVENYISREMSPLIFVIWDSLFKIDIDEGDLVLGYVRTILDRLGDLVTVDRAHFADMLKSIWKSNNLI